MISWLSFAKKEGSATGKARSWISANSVVSVSVSMIIGIIFGVFPARNAARLDPIVALNRE